MMNSSEDERNNNGSSSAQYKGVRKRKWGKYVSEIRLPNSRERIWLGSYESAEKAARAFDAASFCLRGKDAKFNFPDNPPDIPNAGSLTRPEIQAAASKYANEETPPPQQRQQQQQQQQQQQRQQFDGASPSTLSDGSCVPMDGGFSMDWDFLEMGSGGVSDFGVFTGMNDFPGEFLPPHTEMMDYTGDENDGSNYGNYQQSFLWNF